MKIVESFGATYECFQLSFILMLQQASNNISLKRLLVFMYVFNFLCYSTWENVT